MITTEAHIISATRFFYEQAGYTQHKGETIEEGREHCARELAECELRALNKNYSYQWCIDNDTDSRKHDTTKPYYKVWSCTMRNDKGEQVEFLPDIDFGRDGNPWRDPYRRVVEAEMAQARFEAEQQLLTGEQS